MHRVLHILTRRNDVLATGLIRCQADNPDWETSTVDLTQEEPNYDLLIDQIFEADSIQVF